MTMQATVTDLEKGLTHYLAEVEKGNEILICNKNLPVARISPMPPKPKNSSRAGREKGQIKILGEITGPCIPQEDWEMLKG